MNQELSLVGDQFLYSHDLNVSFTSGKETGRSSLMLITNKFFQTYFHNQVACLKPFNSYE